MSEAWPPNDVIPIASRGRWEEDAMATFVLVHGAMHGGWCWSGVKRNLVGRGHDVHTPTLTGQGERRGELTREVGLATHVRDLDEVLWFEDLTDVHLVLHSYAGVLAGPLAQRAGERLASVVFLAAFVAAPGQSLLDVEPADVARRYREQVVRQGDGWLLPATRQLLDQWGIRGEPLREWVALRLTDFPFRCQYEAADFDPVPLDRIRKVYVAHTSPPLRSLDRSLGAAQAAGWETHRVPFGHDLMLEAPAATAALLEAIALGSPETGQ
jgi:pimeloyl-ACP methyl ester carboxylesterase